MDFNQLFANPAYQGLLSEQDQQSLAKQARINAGLALIAASQGGQPGTGRAPLFPALLQGLQAGQQAYTSGAEGLLKSQELQQKRMQQQQRTQNSSELFGNGMPDLGRLKQGFAAALANNDMEYARFLGEQIKAMEPKYEKIGEGDQLIDPATGKVLAQGAPKKPSAVQEYEYAQSQGYQGSFNDFQTQLKRAGASNVSVGFGNDKQLFEGEQGLRKEFKDTPTAKAYNEVKFAYDQVATALKNPSAANDLTAATKFMKILDPGSVVRESELGLAMSATGLFDRVTNYYNQLKTGQRLTPSQREDFYRSATQLYNAALQPYAATRAQYEDVTKRYGFDPARVLGTDVPKPIPETKLNARTDPAAAAKAELERRRSAK